MSAWFTKNLGDAMLAGEALDNIKAIFQSEYVKADYPREMAMFVRHESEGRLHCEVKVYLSPASIAVAAAIDAAPCARPAPDDLGMLAGSEDAWVVFFPRGNNE